MNVILEDGTAHIESRDFPTNKGGLCQKGWTSTDLLQSPDRLTSPLVRDGRKEALRPATWEEALDRIASGIRQVQQKHGRNGVGVSAAAV